MELALSLGDTPKGLSINLDKATTTRLGNKDPFFIALGDANHSSSEGVDETSDPPLQLDLLPFTPLSRPHLPSLSHSHSHSHSHSYGGGGGRALDVNRLPVGVEEAEDGTPVSSSPNSVSSFQMEFCIRNSMVGSRNKREHEGEGERDCSRGSDDEDNGSTRKKLRLSKEQSAFLEESFKEHTTLNPKQKLALAKQLNLRPRQVEVWFQNRRARTKLKQTEVDCEYLKRCCETLTEENRRLQKELQELRALKTSQPFYMQLPATTLTMCPSCERVATTTTNNVSQPPPPLRSIANPTLSSSPFHNNTQAQAQAQAQTHQAHPPSS